MSLWGKITGGASDAWGAVSSAARSVDPTSTRNPVGRVLAPVTRPVLATGFGTVTGGATVLAGELGVGGFNASTWGVTPYVQGVAMGAAGGGAATVLNAARGVAARALNETQRAPVTDTPPPAGSPQALAGAGTAAAPSTFNRFLAFAFPR
jgi:hypothetical protein